MIRHGELWDWDENKSKTIVMVKKNWNRKPKLLKNQSEAYCSFSDIRSSVHLEFIQGSVKSIIWLYRTISPNKNFQNYIKTTDGLYKIKKAPSHRAVPQQINMINHCTHLIWPHTLFYYTTTDKTLLWRRQNKNWKSNTLYLVSFHNVEELALYFKEQLVSSTQNIWLPL